MRVIAGKYKGRKIVSPENNAVRPTTDKVKEAIYDFLGFAVQGAVVVDLFAGTGALGIEALSRGAEKAYFCDGSGASIELLKQNLAFVEKGSYDILRGDYTDCLRRLASRGVKANIVLCDPPYGKKIPEKALEEIYATGILEENGVVVVERETTDNPARKRFAYYKCETYGKTAIDLYKNVTKCAVTGTFDPFTLGHRFLVEHALSEFGFCYVVMLNNETKTARYSVATRLRMIALTLKAYKNRVRIEYCDGMTTEYCNENGIGIIVRGYRDEKDLAYEKEMAAYNMEHGGVTTEIVKSDIPISSTLVKDRFDAGEGVADVVADEIVGLLKKR